MHISLDGFVAGPHGEMNWIKVDEEIFDFVGKRIGQSDTALYAKAHKVVLSKTISEEGLNNTKIISDHLVDRINEIKKSNNGGSEDILVFGSPTATHSLMQLNLIDGFWLFVNPIILGEGIPLFAGNQEKSKLKLLSSHQFANGVTELNYLIEKQL